MTTHIEQVQRIGRAYGRDVSEAEASYILWNHTGFPGFFRSDKPHRELRRQIRRFFREGLGSAYFDEEAQAWRCDACHAMLQAGGDCPRCDAPSDP